MAAVETVVERIARDNGAAVHGQAGEGGFVDGGEQLDGAARFVAGGERHGAVAEVVEDRADCATWSARTSGGSAESCAMGSAEAPSGTENFQLSLLKP